MPLAGIFGAVAAPKAIASFTAFILGYVVLTAYRRPEMLLTFTPKSEDTMQIKSIIVGPSTVQQISMIIKTSDISSSSTAVFGRPTAVAEEKNAVLDSCVCPAKMLPFHDAVDDLNFSCRANTGEKMCPLVFTSKMLVNHTRLSHATWNKDADPYGRRRRALPVGAIIIRSDAAEQIQCHSILGVDSPYCQITKFMVNELRTKDNALLPTESTAAVREVATRTDSSFSPNKNAVALEKPVDSNFGLMRLLAEPRFVQLLSDSIDQKNRSVTIDDGVQASAETSISIEISTISAPISAFDKETTHVTPVSSIDASVADRAGASDLLRAEELNLIERAFVQYSISQQKRRTTTIERLKAILFGLQQAVQSKFADISDHMITALTNVDARLLIMHGLDCVLHVSDFVSNWVNFKTLLVVCDYAEFIYAFVHAVAFQPAMKIIQRAIAAYSVEQMKADIEYLREDFVTFLIIFRNLLSIFVTVTRRFLALRMLDQLFCIIPLLLSACLVMMPFFVVSLPIAELFVRSSRKRLAMLQARLDAVADLYDAVQDYEPRTLRWAESETAQPKSFRVVFKSLAANSQLLSLAALADTIPTPAVDIVLENHASAAVFVDHRQSDDSMLLENNIITPPLTDSTPSTPQHADSDAASHTSDRCSIENKRDDRHMLVAVARDLPEVVGSEVVADLDESFHSFNDAAIDAGDYPERTESRMSTADVSVEEEEENSMSIADSSPSSVRASIVCGDSQQHAADDIAGGGDAVDSIKSSLHAAFSSSFVDKNFVPRSADVGGWDMKLDLDADDDDEDDVRVGSFIRA